MDRCAPRRDKHPTPPPAPQTHWEFIAVVVLGNVSQVASDPVCLLLHFAEAVGSPIQSSTPQQDVSAQGTLNVIDACPADT